MIIEFAYNNTKNIGTDYIFFELNYKYYSSIFYEEDFNSYSKLKNAKELFFKLWKLITIC